MFTFGIGSGVAGLGGVALSQLGNVGPELGQGYIVDSFMVVVLGGVGKLAGTLAGALRPRHRQQVARAGGGRRARQDRDPGVHHPVHPASSAGHLRPQGSRRGGFVTAPTPAPAAKSSNADGIRLERVMSPRGYAVFGALLLIGALLVPLLNASVDPSSGLHLPDYLVTLFGKFVCFATVAVAMDLLWGYAGILSLGHGVFFALGGYAMGMYLMLAIGEAGVYRSKLPDFMVFLDWKELPWFWRPMDNFFVAVIAAMLVPGPARLRVRLLRLPLAHSRRLLLDHHPGSDLRDDAAVLPQRDRPRRQQRAYQFQRDLRLLVARAQHQARALRVLGRRPVRLLLDLRASSPPPRPAACCARSATKRVAPCSRATIPRTTSCSSTCCRR